MVLYKMVVMHFMRKFKEYLNDILKECLDDAGICQAYDDYRKIAYISDSPLDNVKYIQVVKGTPKNCNFYLMSFLDASDDRNFYLTHIIDSLYHILVQNFAKNYNNINSFTDSFGVRLDVKVVAEKVKLEAIKSINTQLQNFFNISVDTIDKLSLTKYEGEKTKGNLLFITVKSGEEIENIKNNFCKWVVEENQPVFSSNSIRRIRKLLAGAESSGLLFVLKKENSIHHFMV